MIAVLVVCVGSVLGYLIWRERAERRPPQQVTGALTPPRTIAVLPLKTLTATENDGSLSISLTDALITKLGSVRGLAVRPTSSVLSFAGKAMATKEIGEKLKVESVLEGTIQSVAGRIRVSVQLVNVQDGQVVWAGTFDDKLSDLFKIQNAFAGQITDSLRLNTDRDERARLVKRDTENAEAYLHYLNGRFFWNQRTPESLKKSIGFYEHALAKDANYALAYAGIADCYQLLAEYLVMTPQEGFTKAKDAATQALAIDDGLAEAHTALAYTLAFYDWDWPGAEREFLRAIEIDPNYPTAHQWFGEYLVMVGRFDEAFVEFDKALDLDPTSMIIQIDLAAAYFTARQFDNARAQTEKVIEMDSNFAYGYILRWFCLEHAGSDMEAAEAYIRSVELFGETKEAEELRKALTEGVNSMWRMRLEQANRPMKRESFPAFWRGLIHMTIGDKQEALDWLEIAFKRRDRWVVNLKYTPAMDSLRSEPRFQTLLQRIGL